MRAIALISAVFGMAFLTGCGGSGHSTDVTGSADAVVTQIEQQVNIQYNQASDQVTISSADASGNATPITLMGTRIDGENFSQAIAEQLCSMLGFTNLAASVGITTSSTTEIDAPINTISGSIGAGATPFADQVAFPALHMNAVVNTTPGTLFTYIPQIASYYFDVPTETDYINQYGLQADANGGYTAISQRKYLSSLICQGTTQVHYDANGNFNVTDFLKNILQNQMGVTIDSSLNHYSQNIPFMVRAPDGAYGIDQDNNENLYLNKDKSLLDSAAAGAMDICQASGYRNLLFYNLRYLLSAEIGSSTVYQYQNGIGWQELPAPAKYTMDVTENVDYASPAKKTIELPGVYLDQVLCY